MNWQARREGVVVALEASELEALIVTNPHNIRYLTGFSGSSGTLVVTTSDWVLFTDFRYEVQAMSEVSSRCRVEIVKDLWKALNALLERRAKWRRVGFEATAVTVDDAKRLDDGGGRLVQTHGIVEKLRASKDAGEIAALRSSAEVACEGLRRTVEVVRSGVREIDIAAELERNLRLLGSEWHPFRTIVSSGNRTALPHAQTSDKEIEPGDLVLIDFGATVDGYCSDLTRTFVVGKPADDKQQTVYELVLRAQQTAVRRIRAGISGAEADSIARQIIEESGFGQSFGHSLGHGIGLEVHEEPRLSSLNDDVLPEGAVVTVEPGIYLPGWGGVRIEDDVYLCAGESEVLTGFPRNLTEL